VSSDASPRTKEPTAGESAAEGSAVPAGPPTAPAEPPTVTAEPKPEISPPAEPSAEDPAEPGAGDKVPTAAPEPPSGAPEAADGDLPHDDRDHHDDDHHDDDHPDEPVGRIAGALDWAWDNRIVRVGLFAAIVIGVLAVWSSHDTVSDSRGSTRQDAAVNARPPAEADIAKVAKAAGCTPQQTVQNTDYKQAACSTPSAHLTITTFRTDTGQQAWLDDAIPYGGAYLIGKRWVVGANDTTGMNKIATALGGTIIDHSKDHN
jgi:hypothetical protein